MVKAAGEGGAGSTGASASARSASVLPRDGSAPWLLLCLVLLAAAVRVYWVCNRASSGATSPLSVARSEPAERRRLPVLRHLRRPLLTPLPTTGGINRAPGRPRGTLAPCAGDRQRGVVRDLRCAVRPTDLRYCPTKRRPRRVGSVCRIDRGALPGLDVRVTLWGTMTEPIYLLLIATAWWALLVAQQERRLWGYAAAGAALALAYLTRNEAIVYLVAGMAAMLLIELIAPSPRTFGRSRQCWTGYQPVHEPISRAAGVKRALVGVALAVGVFAILISPYLGRPPRPDGKWQLLEEAGSTYVSAQGLARNDLAAFDRATWGLDPTSGEVYLFSPTSEGQGLLAAITEDPREFVRLLRINLADLLATTFSSQLIPLVFAGLAILGLFARPWNTRRLRAELLLVASLAGPLSFLPFFIQPRYVAGVLIPALVWIGGGTAWLGDWLAQTWTQLRAERRWGGKEEGVGVSTYPLLRALPALLLAIVMLWQTPRIWDQQQKGGGFRQAHLAAADALVVAGATQDALVSEPVSGHRLPRRYALGADPGRFLARGRDLRAAQRGRFPGAGRPRGCTAPPIGVPDGSDPSAAGTCVSDNCRRWHGAGADLSFSLNYEDSICHSARLAGCAISSRGHLRYGRVDSDGRNAGGCHLSLPAAHRRFLRRGCPGCRAGRGGVGRHALHRE